MGILHPSIPEVSWLDNLSLIILILAGINWVLYGFLDFDVITHYIDNPYVHKFIYLIIGVCAIKALFFWNKCLACSQV